MKFVSPAKLDINNPSSWPIYYKVIMWVLMVGLIWFAFDKMMYTKLRDEEAANNQQIQTLQEDFRRVFQYTVDLAVYRKRSEDLFTELEKLLQLMPSQKEMPQLIDSVATSASEAGLSIRGFVPGKVRPTDDFYDVMPIALDTATYYANFADLAARLTKLERIMNIADFSLVVAKDAGGSAVSGQEIPDDLLRVTGELQTYIYNQDIEAMKKGDLSGVKKLQANAAKKK